MMNDTFSKSTEITFQLIKVSEQPQTKIPHDPLFSSSLIS